MSKKRPTADSEEGQPDGASGDENARSVSSLMVETIRPDATVRFDVEAVRQYQARQRQGSLLVIDGVAADVGRHMVVEQEVTLGREIPRARAAPQSGTPGLQLRDGRISRSHAKVEQLPGGDYILVDLGSTNGTLLNGERIEGQRPLRDGDRVEIGQTVIKFALVDATEANYLRRTEQLAGGDHLTGLMAKHRFDSLLQEAIRVSRGTAAPLSVVMMDLDGLKAINDANGHQMGARTIREVGRLLGRLIQRRGEACRFGGDEFCAFLPGQTLEQALNWGHHLCEEVRQLTVTVGERSIRPSISVGVAVRPEEVDTEEALLELADQALYRAKGKGRDTASD